MITRKTLTVGNNPVTSQDIMFTTSFNLSKTHRNSLLTVLYYGLDLRCVRYPASLDSSQNGSAWCKIEV